ncbi:hypothetical protein D9M68_977960 [compost metagenome]
MALARSRRLGITESPAGLLLQQRVEKGGHFRPAGPCGAMKDRRKLQAHRYLRFILGHASACRLRLEAYLPTPISKLFDIGVAV